jgi:hypothetical protein
MGIVEQPIADGVGQRRLPEVVMPLAGWQLARDDGRAAAVAVLENLKEIAPLLILHGCEAPVIEDEDVHAGELAEQPAVAAVGASEREIVEEPGSPAVVRAVAATAGVVGQRTGDEALPGAGGAGDQDLLMFLDPAAGGELADDGLVELAPRGIVDGLETGLRQLELGFLEGGVAARSRPGPWRAA